MKGSISIKVSLRTTLGKKCSCSWKEGFQRIEVNTNPMKVEERRN